MFFISFFLCLLICRHRTSITEFPKSVFSLFVPCNCPALYYYVLSTTTTTATTTSNRNNSRHHGIEQNQCATLIKHRFELRQRMNNLGRSAQAQLIPSAPALVKFYRDTLDREDMKDFFLRQVQQDKDGRYYWRRHAHNIMKCFV